eukprot:scaffold81236_cov63-Phaeocystis_antarctica.AAC.2
MTLLANAWPDHLQRVVAHIDETEGRALVAPVEWRKESGEQKAIPVERRAEGTVVHAVLVTVVPAEVVVAWVFEFGEFGDFGQAAPPPRSLALGPERPGGSS